MKLSRMSGNWHSSKSRESALYAVFTGFAPDFFIIVSATVAASCGGVGDL
jgi:hypothetical protein